MKKAGTFTANIVLEKSGFLDIALNNSDFDISKPALIFSELKRADGNKTITTAQILGQIRGLSGLGYKLKSIAVSDADIAEVDGTKHNFSIKMKKAGTFTADIVLEKNGFLDIALNNSDFDISSPALTFSELKKADGYKTITTAQILGQIRGLSGLGYKLKSIVVSDGTTAQVDGTKHNFSIKMKKAGTFTANIVLEKSGFLDIALNNSDFDISSPALIFSELKKADGYKTITTAQILGQIRGLSGLGYKLKSIAVSAADIAQVDGTSPDFSIKMKKAGTFTANIVLEKSGFFNVALSGCPFDIQKPLLIFKKLSISYNRVPQRYGKRIFNPEEIFAQIQGQKDGYYIRLLTLVPSSIAWTEMDALTSRFKYLIIKRVGAWSGSIVRLRQNGYFDVEITGCEFDIKPSSEYDKHYNYAINPLTGLGYSKEKAEYYANARLNLNYGIEKAKSYAYARADLKLIYFRAEYYAYGKHDLGYTGTSLDEYLYIRDFYDGQKAQEYVKAKIDFAYSRPKAKAYADARYNFNYGIDKAKEYAKAIADFGYAQAEGQHYAYAREDLGYEVEKAKFYAESRHYYDEAKAKTYAYARADLGYSGTHADDYVKGIHNYGYSQAKAIILIFAIKDLKYSFYKARQYAIARSDFGWDKTKSEHFAYARDQDGLDYSMKRAEGYARARADLSYSLAKAVFYAYAIKYFNDNDLEAQYYAFARHNIGYNNFKAKCYRSQRHKGKTDAQARAYVQKYCS